MRMKSIGFGSLLSADLDLKPIDTSRFRNAACAWNRADEGLGCRRAGMEHQPACTPVAFPATCTPGKSTAPAYRGARRTEGMGILCWAFCELRNGNAGGSSGAVCWTRAALRGDYRFQTLTIILTITSLFRKFDHRLLANPLRMLPTCTFRPY